MASCNKEQIYAAIQNNRIICTPFEERFLTQKSLLITLGYYYYRVELINEHGLYNPLDPEDTERFFDGPYKAATHGQWVLQNGFAQLAHIPADQPVIALHPGERILAHSHQFIAVHADYQAHVSVATPWSNSGIDLTLTDYSIHSNKVDRLLFSLQNHNHNQTILLPLAQPIAEVTFYGTAESETPAFTSSDIESAIQIWSPDKLLPDIMQNPLQMPPKITGSMYE